MALIGEQFDEADEICGVVVSVRQKQDKIALWTKTATNEAAQVLIDPEFCLCTKFELVSIILCGMQDSCENMGNLHTIHVPDTLVSI